MHSNSRQFSIPLLFQLSTCNEASQDLTGAGDEIGSIGILMRFVGIIKLFDDNARQGFSLDLNSGDPIFTHDMVFDGATQGKC